MQDMNNQPRTVREYLRLFFTGMAMGAADVVPGVSGGTMAFILGVYEDLLNAIKSFNLDLIRVILKGDFRGAVAMVPWRFLLALGGGIVAAILSLVTGLEWALENQPVYLYAFFTGLIIASIIAVGMNVQWNAQRIAGLVIGAVVAFLVVGLRPQSMPNTVPFLFFSGMIAITAMILPGVSGAFLLLVLGQYEYVISAIREFNLVAIAAVGAGCAVGIIIFSRILSWLLRRFEQVTVAVLTGFMIGSLRVIWPFKSALDPLETYVDSHGIELPYTRNVLPWNASHTELFPEDMLALTGSQVAIALGLMFFGFVLVSLLDHMQSGRNPVVRPFLGRRKPLDDAQPAGAAD